MNVSNPKYCLDANVLIQAWNNHYSPSFCRSYWDVLTTLGSNGLLFLPQAVLKEILVADDDLSHWLKQSNIPVRSVDAEVTFKWKEILARDEKHQRLVDNTKQRSLADPWIIAHAMREGAIVVTNENKETNPVTNRIKIPNVCEAMGVEWINEFEFIRRTQINFTCASELCQSA